MVTFIHNRGEGDGDIEEYGQFSYDLSSFKGQDVVLAIAIFKGTSNNQEGELVDEAEVCEAGYPVCAFA